MYQAVTVGRVAIRWLRACGPQNSGCDPKRRTSVCTGSENPSKRAPCRARSAAREREEVETEAVTKACAGEVDLFERAFVAGAEREQVGAVVTIAWTFDMLTAHAYSSFNALYLNLRGCAV